MPMSTAVSAVPISNSPVISGLAATDGSNDSAESRTQHQASSAAARANGILAKNTQRQELLSTISPPSPGDKAGAIRATAMTMVEMRARSAP